jgi:hypothetical protein
MDRKFAVVKADAVASGPRPPDNDGMDARLSRLEAVIPTLATKADVGDMKALISETKSSIVMWLSGIVLAGTAITITVLIFAINRAVPPAAVTAAPQPIVIQIPAAVAPPPPLPAIPQPTK